MKIIHRNIVPIYFFLHIIPIVYFLGWFVEPEVHRDSYFILPFMMFFSSGFACWTLHYKLFKRKLYKLYKIGNAQMSLYFPLLWAFERGDLFFSDVNYFSRLAHVYFFFHTLFSIFTIPLMIKDWRNVNNSYINEF